MNSYWILYTWQMGWCVLYLLQTSEIYCGLSINNVFALQTTNTNISTKWFMFMWTIILDKQIDLNIHLCFTHIYRNWVGTYF